jgi:hypothetical protein
MQNGQRLAGDGAAEILQASECASPDLVTASQGALVPNRGVTVVIHLNQINAKLLLDAPLLIV